MVYNHLTTEFGWPDANDIFTPTEPGAKVLVQRTQNKLGRALEQQTGISGIRVGVLASDPDTSDAPLAIVCEFPTPVQETTLLAAHRLAWNFSRSLLLITIEPGIIRKWSCCDPPLTHADNSHRVEHQPEDSLHDLRSPELLPPVRFDLTQGQWREQQAAESLSWIDLVSGAFFRSHRNRFKREQRADTMLLSNLQEVRRTLQSMELEDKYIHDLLARMIFVQFLFDRKDSNNLAALNEYKLHDLYDEGILSNIYTSLADILENYDDTYALFDWLNQQFNGDLFPGDGGTPYKNKAAWHEEQQAVRPEHIHKLAEFVRGDMRMADGQLCLWRHYAFDVIPLEFISSIYEEFVSTETGVGVHYTRDYVVDLMLDRVLPWESDQWDVSILDPACGSGIFLVRAYQRLIYRWKYAHPGEDIPPATLRYVLEHNLMGIDSDSHAVRVASFSLYLAMCDEIDPRHYWSNPDRVRFPALRNKRIIQSDFFGESIPGFRTTEDAGTYDIVIGNPPWGSATLTKQAKQWMKDHTWNIANNDLGMLFIVKSTYLTKPDGLICMVQSTNALLANISGKAVRLRHKLFLDFKKVESVINFAAFRTTDVQLFTGVKVPTCVLTLRNAAPDGDSFVYECPKPLYTGEDTIRILIDEQDTHFIYPHDVIEEPSLWSILMWGGERDRDLIRRLKRYTNLEQMKAQELVHTRRGITPGDRAKKQDELLGKRYVDTTAFSKTANLYLDAHELDPIVDPFIDSSESTDLRAFQLPQLLIKTSWIQRTQRFQAKMVQAPPDIGGVMCSKSLLSVHTPQQDDALLETCCVCFNSIFATYYLFLTSGRLAFDRSEPRIQELQQLPIPNASPHSLEGLNTPEAIDQRVYELFGFQEADSMLIEDMVQYTLADFKGKGNRPGYQPTHRSCQEEATRQLEPELSAYCEVFLKVLKATYGQDKSIGAVIFSEAAHPTLPMRMVGICLNDSSLNVVHVESFESREVRQRILELHRLSQHSDHPSIVYQRCLRTYDSKQIGDDTALIIHIVKPDSIRYWTRSMALRDADEVVADLMMWATSSADMEKIRRST